MCISVGPLVLLPVLLTRLKTASYSTGPLKGLRISKNIYSFQFTFLCIYFCFGFISQTKNDIISYSFESTQPLRHQATCEHLLCHQVLADDDVSSVRSPY